MKHIDKSLKLAKAYHEWLAQLEKENRDHGLYKSKDPFHKDVLMNLIACQDGLCAYTEARIGDCSFVSSEFWKEGRYRKKEHPPQVFADIEHFDPSLKGNKGWLWENLFAVHSVINQRVKRDLPVDPILKPDLEDYDPFQLLDYVFEPDEVGSNSHINHLYVPHPALSPEIKKRVAYMIEVLGINHQVIRKMRENIFKYLVEAVLIGLMPLVELKTEEFPTACEMIRRSLGDK